MTIEDSRLLVARERRFLLAHTPTDSLLIAIRPFLTRLQQDTAVRSALDDASRDALRAHEQFASHDAATIQCLADLRSRIPFLEQLDGGDGQEIGGHTLAHFDALVGAPSELHPTPEAGNNEDKSTSAKLIFTLQIRLHRVTGPLQAEVTKGLKGVAGRHEYAFRAYLMDVRNEAGFALHRLKLVVRQLNPDPGLASSAPAYFDEHYRHVYGDPAWLRSFVLGNATGVRGVQGATLIQTLRDHVTSDANRVSADVIRRLDGRGSREGLLANYKMRCSWYDATGIERLVASLEGERMKEDRLTEHLALFLFDAGIRPLTTALIGRLEPDLFQSLPEDSFYVEVKQYADADGARRAVADGPPQVWSTAARLRAHFELREAFLVVFRRGGPLLRFPEDPVTAEGLTLRPVLVDVAPGAQSGSNQGEVLDVTAEQLLLGR